MFDLHPKFLDAMRQMLGKDDYAAYLDALAFPPLRFARVNPRKPVPQDAIRRELGDFPFLPQNATPGKYPLHAAGAYYVQEPAAAAVAAMLPPLLPQGAVVLDMCAAPGGKVTGAAAARPDCFFMANETVFSRCKPLLQNVERLGLANVTVTSLRPDAIAREGARFDAVIADVPCSGEGMLRKSSAAAQDWSPENVAACAARARKILESCDAALKTGGLLLFSTCTLNKEENEAQITYLTERGYEPIEPVARPERSRRGFGVPQAVRFFPQDGGGEGHFACLMRKTAPAPTAGKTPPLKSAPSAKVFDLLAPITSERFCGTLVQAGAGFELVPPDYPFAPFPALRRGVRLCEQSGSQLVPCHHFASAADPARLCDSPNLDIGDERVFAYLRGETIDLDCAKGYRVLRVCGCTLGLIKASDGTAKNHYPKGLRLF